MSKKNKSTPWGARLNDKSFISPDKSKRILFYGGEIAMGSPLRGTCYIETRTGKIELGHNCGCPAVWSDDNRYLALPLWTDQLDQRIAIVDFEDMVMRRMKGVYRVLHIKSFEDGIVYGVDSPIHRKEYFEIDINTVEYTKSFKLEEISQ